MGEVIYKYKDVKGVTVYSDKPPPGDQAGVQKLAVLENGNLVLANAVGRLKTLEVNRAIQEEIQAARDAIEQQCSEDGAPQDERIKKLREAEDKAFKKWLKSSDNSLAAGHALNREISKANQALLKQDFLNDAADIGLVAASLFTGGTSLLVRGAIAGAGVANDLSRNLGTYDAVSATGDAGEALLGVADVVGRDGVARTFGSRVVGATAANASRIAGSGAGLYSAFTTNPNLLPYTNSLGDLRALSGRLQNFEHGVLAKKLGVDIDALKKKTDEAIKAIEAEEKAYEEYQQAKKALDDAIEQAGGEYRQCVIQRNQAATEAILGKYGRR